MEKAIFNIDGNLKKALKKKCKEYDISMSDFLRIAARSFIHNDVAAGLLIQKIKQTRP